MKAMATPTKLLLSNLLWFATALLAPSQQPSTAKWNLLVTHETPTKEQRGLLSIEGKEDLQKRAKDLACLTMTIDGCTVIYPESLFNLKSVRERTKALHQLSLFETATPTRSLSESQRKAFVALLAPVSTRAALSIANPEAQFAFRVATDLELRADGKTVRVRLVESPGAQFSKPYPTFPSIDDERIAEEGVLREYQIPPIDAVVFTSENRQIRTAERMEKMEGFLKAVREEVEEQTNEYGRTVEAIKKRWSDSLGLPKSGDAVSSFSEKQRRNVESQFELNYKSMGFKTQSEAQHFLERARMAGVRQRLNFETAGVEGNQPTVHAFEVSVRRSPH